MFCEKCGAKVTQKAKYCQSCGVELSNSDDSDTNQVEVSPLQTQPNHNEQHGGCIEKTSKDESKSFLGGLYHPWRRFFARTVDILSIGILIFFLFSFLMGYLFPKNIDGYVRFIENPIGAAIVLYLVWLPIEALFLSKIGTTPAKWIFGIRVISNSGGNLSYANAFKRAFLVFVQGEGFGIPLVTLFTRLFAYRRLTRTGTTIWDSSVESVVIHKKWGVIRAIASVLATLVALVIISVLNNMSTYS